MFRPIRIFLAEAAYRQGRPRPVSGSLHVHLDAAVAWLKRAHDATEDDGVSYGYSVRGGWRPSYRETSGYIAPTFFDLADAIGDPDCRERAIRISRWLPTVQEADGSVGNPRYGSARGVVFDTGQVLFGLLRAWRELGEDAEFLEAAERAGRWLVDVADARGTWTRNTHLGVPHVYNTRVAWALLELNTVRPDSDFERVARANLDFALDRREGNLFRDCAFRPGVPPFTHTIAYAIRGLLESGSILGEARYAQAARAAADTMLVHVTKDGFIPGAVDTQGRARARYCCLTGNCQLAIIWAKLHDATGEVSYRDAAERAVRYVAGTQRVEGGDSRIRGGIKGSHPVWGRYAPFSYPNWAAKFFIDAVLLVTQRS